MCVIFVIVRSTLPGCRLRSAIVVSKMERRSVGRHPLLRNEPCLLMRRREIPIDYSSLPARGKTASHTKCSCRVHVVLLRLLRRMLPSHRISIEFIGGVDSTFSRALREYISGLIAARAGASAAICCHLSFCLLSSSHCLPSFITPPSLASISLFIRPTLSQTSQLLLSFHRALLRNHRDWTNEARVDLVLEAVLNETHVATRRG